MKYEIELKSRFIFFLDNFLRKNNLQIKDLFNSLENYDYHTNSMKNISQKTIDKIKKEWKRQTDIFSIKDPDYSDYYYLLIKVLNFETIGIILNHSYNGQKIYTLFKNYLDIKKNFL